MLLFQQSEATAAQRRFPVYLVDATDGITPETGEAAGQPQVSKQGGAWANTTATLTAVGNGMYYVELTATELNTVGLLAVRFKSANTAEYNMHAMVVPFDPYDSVRLGLTALPNAAADAAGGLPISDAGALDLDALNTNVSAILTDTGTTLDNHLTDIKGTGFIKDTHSLTDILADVTGLAGSAMRGTDSALLASSAPTNFGDLAITVTTGQVTVGTNNDKTGYGLAANAIDNTTLTAAAGEEIADAILGRNIAGGSNGGRDVTSALRYLRNKVSISGGTMTVTQEDDTTSAWTAAVSTTAGDPISSIDPA